VCERADCRALLAMTRERERAGRDRAEEKGRKRKGGVVREGKRKSGRADCRALLAMTGRGRADCRAALAMTEQ